MEFEFIYQVHASVMNVSCNFVKYPDIFTAHSIHLAVFRQHLKPAI
jgi:hypothetical protein